MKATNDECIAALRASKGRIAEAAEMLGMSYQGLSQRIKKNAKMKDIAEHIREKGLDIAETKLSQAVEKGEAWAVCFYLKCQGKNRGWVESQLHKLETDKDGITIRVKVDDAD